MKRKLALLALTAAMISVPAIACASQAFFNHFKVKYPNAASLSCVACHNVKVPKGVNPARNGYGAAWALHPHGTVAQRNVAFNLTEKDDSDGDGYTNLTEITACTPAIKVLPGFAALPANLPTTGGWRAVPPRLLFFDNFKNANGPAIPNWTRTGNWRGDVGTLLSPALNVEAFVNPTPPNAPLALTNFRVGTISAKVKLVNGVDASIIFSQDPGRVGFRMVTASTSEITIDQDGTVGGVPVGNITPTRIPFVGFAGQATHTLRIVLSGTGLVTVFVDNLNVGTHQFTAAVAGQTGFRTKVTGARFDDMTVSR